MSWKSLTVLAVLAAALGGFFVYDSYWLTPAREKSEASKGRLWEAELKDVEAVTLKRKTDTVTIKRAGDGWELTEPVKARGDRSVIDGVVTTLTTLRVDREIDAKPTKLAEFGLEPPEAEVRLTVKGRAEPLVVLIGVKSPTGAWVYGKEGAKPAVIALSEVASRDVTRPVTELRDKTVLAFDRKSVTGFDIDIGGDKISVEAQDGGKWRISKPGPYPGDADSVADFLDKLDGAKVKEFVADPTPPAKYGFDKPATVTLWLGRDKDRSSRVLQLGRVESDKKGVYVMRPGESEAMLTGEELWTAFPKTTAVLRDKVVLAYAYDKVKRLELESPKGPLAIEKDGAGWKVAAPEALKADPGAVNGLLWRVRDLRSAGFLGEEARDIPKYLAKPEVTVRLWEEGAKEPKTLLLAPSKETRGGQAMAVAAVAGQGPVVLVDGKALQDFAKTADDIRDKTLFPAFDLPDVKKARVTGGGKQVLVERKGDADWRLVEPKGSAKEGKVTDLLLAVKGLRWKEIASAKGDDAARFGLDKPQLEVTFLKGDGAEIGTLVVGKEEGAVTYVRLKASPVIYAVETRLIGDLRKAPSEIPG